MNKFSNLDALSVKKERLARRSKELEQLMAADLAGLRKGLTPGYISSLLLQRLADKPASDRNDPASHARVQDYLYPFLKRFEHKWRSRTAMRLQALFKKLFNE